MKTLYEQNQKLPIVMTASKQQTIADTARRLFREHGFSAVSVGGIYAEAAVSRVTFYKYYSGKNALLQEIVTEQKNRVRAEFENLLARQYSLREAAEAIQPDLPVELIDLFIRQADILMRHPQLAALYAAAPQKLPQDVLGLLLHGLAGEEGTGEEIDFLGKMKGIC